MLKNDLNIAQLSDEELDNMTLEEIEAELAKYPKEEMDKIDELLRAFGIALGEAREAYFEKLMKEAEAIMEEK